LKPLDPLPAVDDPPGIPASFAHSLRSTPGALSFFES
jgi:hypothetical protein